MTLYDYKIDSTVQESRRFYLQEASEDIFLQKQPFGVTLKHL